MAGRHTQVNLDDVEDAAPGNGFGDRWEARVARTPLGSEQTGVTHFRLRAGKRSPFSHRHTHAEEIYVILSGSGKVKLADPGVPQLVGTLSGRGHRLPCKSGV